MIGFNRYSFVLAILIGIGLLSGSSLYAQSKKELEEKRRQLTKEIEVTSKLLKKTTRNKETAYERFVTLQNQIERRENLIQTIQDEIVALDENMARTQDVIASLSQDIAHMQDEYGRMVRAAYRRRSNAGPLLFLLSAEGLNQAFRRWLFLRKYDRLRKGQAEAIAFTKDILTKKIAGIEQSKTEKEELLASMQGQRATLTNEMKDKNNMLANLNQDVSRLNKELQQKLNAKANLDNAIDRIITAEIAKRKTEKAQKAEEQKKRETPNPKSETPNPKSETPNPKSEIPNPKSETPNPKSEIPNPKSETSNPKSEIPNPKSEIKKAEIDEDAPSKSFRKMKGKLPRPVEGGFVSRGYGRQKHPTLKNIEITNNGIDIRTDEDAPVKAVHEGKVAGVQFIPGHDYTVIIQHGDFYTVYSNLSQTSLSKGDAVGAGQSIGSVSTNPISGAAELHFEVWYQKERMNPSFWIK